MQTILGSGGAIGTALAKELASYTDKIRLVSRNPRKVNERDELFPADITDPLKLENAIAGSEIVYVTVGFEYNIRVWRKYWPPLIRNVLEYCKKYRTKLVFFDNIYMIDRDYLHDLTEDAPVRPTSKKGQVRAEIAGMILKEAGKGDVDVLIARCADFYGLKNSVLVETVIKNLMKGKKAMWIANAGKKHSYTSVLDAARATAILGNTPDAYNQVWHLPTSYPPLNGKQWIELVAGILKTKPRYFVLPVGMLRFMGLFVVLFRELAEMSYQYDRDYVFRSDKFENRFNFEPVKPTEGIARLIKELDAVS